MRRKVLGWLILLPALAGGCQEDNGRFCKGWPEVRRPDGTWAATCREGTNCFDGYCSEFPAEDCDPNFYPIDPPPEPASYSLEPNGRPELAVTLPCGDDGAKLDPAEYATRCPSRGSYQNGFMHLMICPNPERDLFRFYLLPDETITFRIQYQYSDSLPRDLDLAVWLQDPLSGELHWVAESAEPNDFEELTVTSDATSDLPEGWYFVEVYGHTEQDRNFYNISFTLNP